MSTHEYDYIFKILLIGDDSSGKLRFISRFIGETNIKSSLNLLGIDFKLKVIEFANKRIKLKIYDTSENEKYRNITRNYFKGTHGIIFMYDITDQDSFKSIPVWIKHIKPIFADKSLKKVLVGNNCDESNRVVSEEEGKKLAGEFNLPFFESSDKTGKNVKEIFYYLVEEILKEKGEIKEEEKIKEKSIKLSNDKGKNKNKECAK